MNIDDGRPKPVLPAAPASPPARHGPSLRPGSHASRSPTQFRLLVSRVLAIGVATSAILITAGFLAALAFGWQASLVGAPASPAPLTDFGAVWSGLVAVRPVAVVQLGLLVLVATPVVRVATTCAAFVLEGDRTFAALTAIVLVILLAGLVIVR
jgi:uncharacterized membrane protein